MNASICIEMIYPELSFEHRIRRVADAGLDGIEFWGWRDKDLPKMKAVANECGVAVTNMSGHRKGSPISSEDLELFITELDETVAVAQNLGCTTLMLLSNELGEGGRVRNSYPEREEAKKETQLLVALEAACSHIPENFSLVIEPLNTRLDHPGNFLSGMEQAVRIVDELAHPRVRVLADLYHLAVMGEDPLHVAGAYGDKIGYVHIADVPGRHEPGTGTIQWAAVLRRLGESGYAGTVGFEYAPDGDSQLSLQRIAELWSNVNA